MKRLRLLLLCAVPILGGFVHTSCSNDPEYRQVIHGGTYYYVDHYGRYYRYYGNGYHPCPKPPGKPDRPPKPVHPIARPPIIYPGQPTTLPAGGDRTRPLPRTQPVAYPAIRPRQGR